MPAFYRHAVQDDGSPGKGDVDKAKVLEQQTMEMQMEWRQQEAAAKSCVLLRHLCQLHTQPVSSLTQG